MQSEAHGDVPADMAVLEESVLDQIVRGGRTHHDPDSRIISVESEDEEAALAGGTVAGKERDVATRGVAEVQLDAAVIGAVASCQNVEIVAVEMDGVAERDGRFDDDVDPLAEIGD